MLVPYVYPFLDSPSSYWARCSRCEYDIWKVRLFARCHDFKSNCVCVYGMFSYQSPVWYVGKASAIRKGYRGLRPWPGFVARFREHLECIVERNGPQSHRERYKVWRSYSLQSVLHLPVL